MRLCCAIERKCQAYCGPKLSLVGQFQHTLIAPWVPYFLLAVGGSLIVFEFFTISIGIAGVVGAASLAFAFYGFFPKIGFPKSSIRLDMYLLFS